MIRVMMPMITISSGRVFALLEKHPDIEVVWSAGWNGC
jgi:hypothetical protein